MTVGATDIYLCLHNLKYIILLWLSPSFYLLSILFDTPPNIDYLLEAKAHADVPIVVNQVEFHPFIKQSTLQTFMNNHHILLEAYSPLARSKVFDNDIIKAIANKHNITPAQVSLAWILSDNKRIAIPKTANPEHLQGNLDAAKVQLDSEDIAQINTLASSAGRMIEHPDYTPNWDD